MIEAENHIINQIMASAKMILLYHIFIVWCQANKSLRSNNRSWHKMTEGTFIITMLQRQCPCHLISSAAAAGGKQVLTLCWGGTAPARPPGRSLGPRIGAVKIILQFILAVCRDDNSPLWFILMICKFLLMVWALCIKCNFCLQSLQVWILVVKENCQKIAHQIHASSFVNEEKMVQKISGDKMNPLELKDQPIDASLFLW